MKRLFFSVLLCLAACDRNPMPAAPTYAQLVSPDLVSAAVAKYVRVADADQGADILYRLSCGSLAADPVCFVNATHLARETAYEAQFVRHRPEMSADEALLAYTSNWYPTWRKLANDAVRAELRDPERLMAAYRLALPAVQDVLATSEKPGRMAYYLETVVIPTFAAPVPEHLLALYRAEAAAWSELEPHEYDGTINWNRDPRAQAYELKAGAFAAAAKAEGFPDPQLLQWRLRRHAEGGDALVEQWGKIFEQLRGLLILQQSQRMLESEQKKKELQAE